MKSEGNQLAQNLSGDKADAVKHISARVSIKLAGAKSGLARVYRAQGGRRVHKHLHTYYSWIPTGTHKHDWMRVLRQAHGIGMRKPLYLRKGQDCIVGLGL